MISIYCLFLLPILSASTFKSIFDFGIFIPSRHIQQKVAKNEENQLYYDQWRQSGHKGGVARSK